MALEKIKQGKGHGDFGSGILNLMFKDCLREKGTLIKYLKSCGYLENTQVGVARERVLSCPEHQ